VPTMASLDTLFAELSAGLRNNGAPISARPLEVLGLAASFLAAIGCSGTHRGDLQAAALVLALLPPEAASTMISNLGLPGDLRIDLKLQPFGPELQLVQLAQETDRNRAILGACVLFVRYALAVQSRNQLQADGTRRWADTLVQPGSRGIALGHQLIAEMDKLGTIVPPIATSPGINLFSISIDLAGSTKAKTQILETIGDNSARLDHYNLQINKRFARIESTFYESCVSQYGLGHPLEINRFYAVKGMGDEIWILYHVAPEEVKRVGRRLIDAALRTCHESIRFPVTEHEEDFRRHDANFNFGKTAMVNLAVKVVVDLIKHASGLGSARDDHLRAQILRLFQEQHKRPPTALEAAELTQRLSLGVLEPLAWSEMRYSRADFVGHEVDRFFRITKYAVPGTATIGQQMVSEMGLRFHRAEQKIRSVHTGSSGAALYGGHPTDPIYSRKQKRQLKGIDLPYAIHKFFCPRSLNTLYVQMAADKQNRIKHLEYEETAKLLPVDSVAKLAKSLSGFTPVFSPRTA
jgi:hypothetical protein